VIVPGGWCENAKLGLGSQPEVSSRRWVMIEILQGECSHYELVCCHVAQPGPNAIQLHQRHAMPCQNSTIYAVIYIRQS
jgi:hypothetical protein